MVLLVVLGGAVLVPAEARAEDPAAGQPDSREKSRVAFRKGVAQLRAQDWGGARASFESAWALYPHPSILLNLGVARLRTDDPVRAEQDLVRFLSEDLGGSPEELAGAREALAEARTKIGTIRVSVSPESSRVVVDGKAVETVRPANVGTSGVLAEVRVTPGRHLIEVEADGFAPVRRELEVTAMGEAVATVALSPLERTSPRPSAEAGPSPRAIVGWSLAGLAGAALVTSGVTALRAMSLSDDYGDPTSSRFQDADVRSEGIAYRTSADVAFSIALLGGGVAAVLLLTNIGKTPSDAARPVMLRW